MNNLIEFMKNLPIVYYIVIVFVVFIIYYYTNYGLGIYNKIINVSEIDTNIVAFTDDLVISKFLELEKILGTPQFIESNNNLFTESVTWRLNYNDPNFIYGKFNSFD